MINLKEFLKENVKGIGCYALVTYNGVTEATWFTPYEFNKEKWFLESPCALYKICEVDKPIDEFCNEYVENCLELTKDTNIKDYINDFVKPMIADGCFYEIENFQTEPYLPSEVDNIEIISERQCLEWMLNRKKEKQNANHSD